MYYALIMAGGSGTRLWPLSRENRPKQSLVLVDKQSMFQHAVSRLRPLFAPENIWVVTRFEHAEILMEQTPELPRENFILEPIGRGTAPAIGLGMIHLRQKDPQAIIAVLTADHYIADTETYRKVLIAAEEVARQGFIVTLGIKPFYPSTGYGYIEQGQLLGETNGFSYYRVRAFSEKPNRDTANRMVMSGLYSWNSGMFIWKIEQIAEEFQRQMPEFYRQLLEVEASIGTDHYQQTLSNIWPRVAQQTIDYGVMEGAQNVAVIPVEMGWTDVGSWGSLEGLLPQDDQGNSFVGEHIGIESRNLIVIGGTRLIATIGVEDLIVVDTDDALLVCSRAYEQQVRDLVEKLKQTNRINLV